jgi:hypothetical protein
MQGGSYSKHKQQLLTPCRDFADLLLSGDLYACYCSYMQRYCYIQNADSEIRSCPCIGGAARVMAEKRSRILVTLKSRLSTSLAKQMAQRIFGHVRGSAVLSCSVHGQYSHPISALLSLSKTADSE